MYIDMSCVTIVMIRRKKGYALTSEFLECAFSLSRHKRWEYSLPAGMETSQIMHVIVNRT